jgi:hypothetical protein
MCYLFYSFSPLNTVNSELELEESVSELMTGHEVHDGGDKVLKIEGKLVKVLILAFAYRSTCYLFYGFTQLKRGLHRA